MEWPIFLCDNKVDKDTIQVYVQRWKEEHPQWVGFDYMGENEIIDKLGYSLPQRREDNREDRSFLSAQFWYGPRHPSKTCCWKWGNYRQHIPCPDKGLEAELEEYGTKIL